MIVDVWVDMWKQLCVCGVEQQYEYDVFGYELYGYVCEQFYLVDEWIVGCGLFGCQCGELGIVDIVVFRMCDVVQQVVDFEYYCDVEYEVQCVLVLVEYEVYEYQCCWVQYCVVELECDCVVW